MSQRGPPGRIGEGLLGLQSQAVARDHPADPFADAGADQRLGGEDRQQRLAAAGCDGSEDVTQLGRLASRDGANDCKKLTLMAAQRSGWQAGWILEATTSAEP